jgi:hypothetical protein
MVDGEEPRALSSRSRGLSALGGGALRVVVLGYVVRGPIGGLAWHHLQYVLGFVALGHDVYYVEDSDDYPSCYDPTRYVTDTDPTYGLRFASQTFARVGLGERWAYFDAHTSRWLGPCAARILEVCATADLVVNVSGVNPLRPWFLDTTHRVLVDTDPVFTQIRHLSDAGAHARAQRHTAFFTFGENVGTSEASVPDDGLPWAATRQPIVLEAWPVSPGKPHGRFTTVMLWDSYPARVYEGRPYGMKSASFEPYVDLPQRSAGATFELAVGSPSAPIERLRAHGWRVRDPLEPTRDAWSYQEYIRGSKAEFSIAKHGYVVTRCGWFSERSAAYLASGRPTVVQDTGFDTWLPGGTGVLPFGTPDEALAAVDDTNRRYEVHCRAARELAVELFDARKVLSRLIEETYDGRRRSAAEAARSPRERSASPSGAAPRHRGSQ